MTWTDVTILLATQCVLAMLGTWSVRQWAFRIHLLDVPNDRSSHVDPTPRGGGLAIGLVFFAGVAVEFAYKLIALDVCAAFSCSLLVATIGLCDDISPVRARVRFIVQLTAAMVSIGLLLSAGSPVFHSLAIQCLIFVSWVAALVWATNLFNFMDGIDGLAGGEAVFLASAAALIFHQFNLPQGFEVLALTIGATSAGFLVLNWSPASIFMGDVGSAFLGFTLALTGMYATFRFSIPLEVWVILSGVFFVDSTLTLLVRAFRGQNPAQAHRSHAYQHFASAHGHRATVYWVTGINVFWLLPWAIAAAHFAARSTLCLVFALAPVVAGALYLRAGRDSAIKR